MPLQDLTPQLRTRLNKMERAVGWFVFLATALLLFGFGYYLYHTAERKGWFVIKAPFYTFVKSSAGLNVGDPVVMMGFPVGDITRIHAMPPGDPHNVLVEFEVRDNYFRYLWTGGSVVKVNSADFLGKRQLELTRATNGYAICVTQPVSIFSLDEARKHAAKSPGHWQLAQDVLDENSNLVFTAYQPVETVLDASNELLLAHCLFASNSIYIYDNTVNRDRVVASWHHHTRRYENFKPGSGDAYLHAVEPPSIADELQGIVSQVQDALPGILSLTNKISAVLDNAANATSNLNNTLIATQPLVTNANALVVNVDANLNLLTMQVGATLENLAGITSNLNVQVGANSNMLASISKAVVDADDLVQGLKRHWFLRSAFKTKATNAPPAKATRK